MVITIGLERIERLLKRLGSPEKKLPPLVHVAGTNGKGSLVAYLRAMAEAAGYRVHVYTSPHLVRFNERIRIAGRLIDDHALDEMLTECEEAHGDTPISFFDITTALAFLAFSRVPADLGIIEVGMGGRYDSTNVIEPALSAITPIGYDHTGFLGDKLEGIAGEKAGIIKRATPVVVGRQRDVSSAVIAAEAAKLAAPMFRMGREWQVTPTARGFRYESDLSTLELPAPALAGAHQFDNAATAVACIERLRAAGFAIDDLAITKGLSSVEWPARLQRLTRGPLVEAMPPGSELWLDGGHNEDCGLSPAMRATGRRSRRRCRSIWCSGCSRPRTRRASCGRWRVTPLPPAPCRSPRATAPTARPRPARRRPRSASTACPQTTSARRWRTCWPPSPRRCAS